VKIMISQSMRLCLVLIVFFFCTSAVPHAQEPPKTVQPPKTVPRGKPELRVFSPRYIGASQLHHTITELIGDNPKAPPIRMAAEMQGNHFIVWADPVDIESIQQMINAIDKESEQAHDEPRMQTLPLKDVDIAVLQQALTILPVQVKFALADANRQLIVTGDDKTLAMVANLVKSLDRPPPPLPDWQGRVRIVWLATGKMPAGAASPPADLKGVVAELARIGVENPRLVTQAVGNISTDNLLSIDGLADLDGPYNLKIKGQLGKKSGETIELAISINANKLANQGGVLQLSTTITAPPGHAVVLGVTPSGPTTSIFIVQLLEKSAPD
jgi:hypothetical protein